MAMAISARKPAVGRNSNPPKLQSTFSPRTPKHHRKLRSTRDQRARRLNNLQNPTKSARPPVVRLAHGMRWLTHDVLWASFVTVSCEADDGAVAHRGTRDKRSRRLPAQPRPRFCRRGRRRPSLRRRAIQVAAS